MIQNIKSRDSYYRPPPATTSDKGKGKERAVNQGAVGDDSGQMVRGLNDDNEGDTGLSYLFVITGDNEARYLYISSSIQDILGYAPSDLLGKSVYLIFHPEEIPVLTEIHYRALAEETCACVAYQRLLHREGYFVECAVSYSTVYGKSVGIITRAEDGPRTIQQALTAREVIEVSPNSQGKFNLKRHPKRYHTPSTSPNPSDPSTPARISPPLPRSSSSRTSTPAPDTPWDLPKPSLRNFFLIDRFTDTSRVMYVGNEAMIKGSRLKGQPFYSVIKPSDRPTVRKWIDSAKEWSPVVYSEKRSGGHGYARFSVLKIPDYPPGNEAFPTGTDESERLMPGQEFIPVEGIFTACSDGLLCVISKLTDRPGKRKAE